MLGMCIGKGQNLAARVPGGRHVLPRTRIGLDGEVAVVNAVVPFVDENHGLAGSGASDIGFLFVGGEAGNQRLVLMRRVVAPVDVGPRKPRR